MINCVSILEKLNFVLITKKGRYLSLGDHSRVPTSVRMTFVLEMSI